MNFDFVMFKDNLLITSHSFTLSSSSFIKESVVLISVPGKLFIVLERVGSSAGVMNLKYRLCKLLREAGQVWTPGAPL